MATKRLTVVILSLLVAQAAAAADGPVERWAKAVGGREKVAAIQSIYREASVHVAGMDGTIKIWRTADGKYRKEEQVGPYSVIETFDGTSVVVQQGGTSRILAGPEREVAVSKSFANSNAVFFVFFPERRRGTVSLEGDDTVVFKPDGGIDWRVTLDPQTSLPKTMVHQEGERTITVSFTAYETVDGYQLEKEIHRTAGDPRHDADIRFTKTVINAPIDPALFTAEPKTAAKTQ